MFRVSADLGLLTVLDLHFIAQQHLRARLRQPHLWGSTPCKINRAIQAREGVWIVVWGEVRIHPENARMSGRHGVQYVAQCVQGCLEYKVTHF